MNITRGNTCLNEKRSFRQVKSRMDEFLKTIKKWKLYV